MENSSLSEEIKGENEIIFPLFSRQSLGVGSRFIIIFSLNGKIVFISLEEMLKEAIKRPVIDRFAQEGIGLLVSV